MVYEVGVLEDQKFLVIDFLIHLRPAPPQLPYTQGLELPVSQPGLDLPGQRDALLFMGKVRLSSSVGIPI